MKFICLKEKLIKSLVLSEKVTAKNLSLPILSNVLINVKDKILTLKATNLDVGFEMSFPVKSEKDGEIVVDPRILLNFLNNIKEDNINIEVVDSNIHIYSDNYSTIIKTHPTEDFPTIPKIKSKEIVKIDNKSLVDGLKSVYYSAAISDIRPEISSVYIYQDNSDLVFVSTDSSRLAEKKIKVETNINSLIIPFKNTAEIVRIFSDEEGETEITYNENQVSFKNNEIIFISRLIDGVYPDYRQIMPKEFSTSLKIKKEEIIQALKLSNIFSNQNHQIQLHISPKDDLFELISKNDQIGENTTLLKTDIEGEEIEVYFNARYILDSFQSINSDEIFLGLNGKNKPLFIKGVGDKSFSYIVMPVNR